MSESDLNALTIRPAEPFGADRGYLYSTWLKWYKDHSYFAKRIKHSVYFDAHQAVLDQIFEGQSTKSLCCVYENEPEVIVGYLVYSLNPITIHFSFVKKDYQNEGVFKSLIKESGIDLSQPFQFTHWTFDTNWMVDRYPEGVYNPYLILK